MNRARSALLLAVAMLASTASPGLAGPLTPGVPPPADERAALGAGAERLPDGHWLIHLADGSTLQTHGPDPDVPDHGTSIGPGDPERDPVCATDYYQHVLYGYPSGSTNRLSTVKPTIQAAIRRMNAVLYEEAALSGNRGADYKVKCDSSGAVQVDAFASSASDFTSIANSANNAGFNSSKADYSIFYDGTVTGICGTGSLHRDERLSVNNSNNSGGAYAVSYSNCWTNRTPMHENGHNQGAVQINAPNSTGTGHHCNEDYDVMCYSPDGGDRNQGDMVLNCTDRMHFDCGHDTYFNIDPEPGTYLASNWNLGSELNRFIVIGPPITAPPTAALSIGCVQMTCDFTDLSTDDGAIAAWAWEFGDGATASTANPQHTYTEPGTVLVSLTVTDGEGDTGTTTQTLVVPNDGDTDPSVPTLTNGVAMSDRNAGQGTWRTFKIFVPKDERQLHVTLDGPSCLLPLFCNPDLDLYVRRGHAPTRDEFECSSLRLSNDETCTIADPPAGTYYIGVYTFFALPGVSLSSVDFTVRATY